MQDQWHPVRQRLTIDVTGLIDPYASAGSWSDFVRAKPERNATEVLGHLAAQEPGRLAASVERLLLLRRLRRGRRERPYETTST